MSKFVCPLTERYKEKMKLNRQKDNRADVSLKTAFKLLP